MLLGVVASWLLWASAVPFGEAPDEPSHLEVAQFVATHGRLPAFGPHGDMYVRLDQIGIPIESHALAPPLTYLVDAVLIRVLPVAPPVAVRLGSLLAALAAVGLAYAFVRAVLPGQRGLALAVAALVAAVPQFSFQAAVANSDIVALATALAASTLALRASGPLGYLSLGVAVGCALLAKYTAYPAAAIACLVAGWRVCVTRPGRWPRAAGLLGLVALGAAVVGGPWLAHNWRLYGEPWPLTTSEAAFRASVPATLAVAAPGLRRLWEPDYLPSWAIITFRSFWAGFDRVSLFAPGWVYVAVLVALAVAGVGLGRLFVAERRVRATAVLDSPAGLLLVGWPPTTLLAAVAMSLGRYYPVHGRYLLPLLPVVVLALAVGWRAVVPERWAALAPWALVAGMLALNAYCLLGVVVPHYYGPAAARVTLTVDSPRPGDVATQSVTIRGWAVVAGRPAWQPDLVGGPPAWYLPAASVWATVDGEQVADLVGGAGATRPDVARALDAPAVTRAGFDYQWDAGDAGHGMHTVEVCAADPSAAEASCVPLPIEVPGVAGAAGPSGLR
ncbi:MAG TPA: hypothetical protein VII06_24335 [Chloroflexota bacterium]|jgi:hypothetical protein